MLRVLFDNIDYTDNILSIGNLEYDFAFSPAKISGTNIKLEFIYNQSFLDNIIDKDMKIFLNSELLFVSNIKEVNVNIDFNKKIIEIDATDNIIKFLENEIEFFAGEPYLSIPISGTFDFTNYPTIRNDIELIERLFDDENLNIDIQFSNYIYAAILYNLENNENLPTINRSVFIELLNYMNGCFLVYNKRQIKTIRLFNANTIRRTVPYEQYIDMLPPIGDNINVFEINSNDLLNIKKTVSYDKIQIPQYSIWRKTTSGNVTLTELISGQSENSNYAILYLSEIIEYPNEAWNTYAYCGSIGKETFDGEIIGMIPHDLRISFSEDLINKLRITLPIKTFWVESFSYDIKNNITKFKIFRYKGTTL